MTSSWAIVGCGHVAPAHVTSLRAAGADVIAAVEPNQAAAEKFAARYEIPVFPTVADMVAKTAPHAATVAVPHDAHAPVIMALLDAGVAALSEKPLARTVAECRAILDAEQTSGLPVGTILNMRGLDYARALRCAVVDGRLTVRDVAVVGELVRRPHDIWQSDGRRAGGGILMEVGIHYLDLWSWWFGGATTGRCSVTGSPVEHSAEVEAHFGADVHVTMTLRAVHETGTPVTVTITADEGIVQISGARVTSGAELLFGSDGSPLRADELASGAAASEDLPFGEGHLRVVGDAVEQFAQDRTFPVGAREGAVSVALTSALYAQQEDLAAAIADFRPLRSGSS